MPSGVYSHDGWKASRIAKELSLPADAVVVADRAYVDFPTFYRWNIEGSYSVVRLKNSIPFKRGKGKPLPEKRHQHVLLDEYIELSHSPTYEKYPARLLRVVIYDSEKDQTIELITNQFTWTANTIGELYKARWDIEFFFKEIMQLLKIKSFLVTTANAVLIQIPAAMITMLILKYLKACFRKLSEWCLSNMVAFLRLNLFVKFDRRKLLDKPFEPARGRNGPDLLQGVLFEWGIDFRAVKKSVQDRQK